MLKTFLTKHEHSVVEAFSFDEAVKRLHSENFDVVLTDFRLPKKAEWKCSPRQSINRSPPW
jgi:DNA-binding response OmpR family regulator